MRRVDSLEKTVMLGGIGGRRRRGWKEDEMAGWHHWLDGRESGWTPGDGDGQGGLACCDSWGRKESDTTERLIWSDLICFMVTQCFLNLIQQNLSENTETSENFPKVFSAQSWLTLSDLMDRSPSGSSVPGISQARIWDWVAISFSRGSSWPRNQTCISRISCTGRQILYHWATWEARKEFGSSQSTSYSSNKMQNIYYVPSVILVLRIQGPPATIPSLQKQGKMEDGQMEKQVPYRETSWVEEILDVR